MGREENRTQQREEKREEQVEQQAEKAGTSSRLGREAKIGVTAILLLLIIFGVVVVVRLTRSSPDGQSLASAAPQNADKDGPGDSATDDALFKGFRSGQPSGASAPTVVPATAAPMTPPRTHESRLDKWKTASNRAVGQVGNLSHKMDEHVADLSAPPPSLPDLPKPTHGSRYSDPPMGHELGDLKPLREPAADARLGPPLEEKQPRPAHAGSGGFASNRPQADRADPPLPPHREREKPRDERSTALAPPSLPPDTSYAEVSDPPAPARPVSRYGENNHRHSPPSYSSPPPRREDGKYEVQPNDSYWTISEKVYGTTAYFKALYEHNRNMIGDDERLKPGALISTPSVAELEKSFPDLCPKPSRRETRESRATLASTRQSYHSGRTYTVSEGDTLFNIARYELGKASRWVEIYELNREVLGRDFNYLTPGMKLTLPDGEKSDTVAEPPSRGYRR